ncbi:LOB domain-containing protein [Vigna angularis]|uniref:LOB domain-containing protein n=3 Tax=Phaseolus angularis TaxID=3914 RepID=A0A8T0LAX6_PHAAN|nr:LOB domain-containing protein [Vigna angularis]
MVEKQLINEKRKKKMKEMEDDGLEGVEREQQRKGDYKCARDFSSAVVEEEQGMTPCGACKYQRRRCGSDCVMVSYFPAESIQRFAYVHHVFGGGNVSNILRSTSPDLRKWVARALAYQAEARVRDPVHGCVGLIWEQEETLGILKEKLEKAKRELAQYVGPDVMQKMIGQCSSDPHAKTVDLKAPLSAPVDFDLSSWDPFPAWESSSSRRLPSQADAKGKTIAPPS